MKKKISDVDIISCATLSKTPLVFGKYLKKGQHIDLVGAYKKDMREADDETYQNLYLLDTFQGGLKESGDIVIPLQNGTLKKKKLKQIYLNYVLIKKLEENQIKKLLFLNQLVMHLEDLAAANYYYNKYTNE